jgi:hypothetical protein
MLALSPNLASAEADIARLVSAPRPRTGIVFAMYTNVGFLSRSENYFRKSINLEDPINPYISQTTHLT